MSDRKNEQAPGNSPRRSVTPLPASVRNWRRLVRVRNGILGVWLGGLACDILTMPLMGVFPSRVDQILGAMIVLTIIWLSGACVGVVLQLSIEKHLRATFQTQDIFNLGCWIDTLFAQTSTKAYPQLAKYYADARAGLLEQLPQVTDESAYLLRPHERNALYKTLNGTDAELIHAVLRVVPVLGDARALPCVRHLAEGNGLAAANTDLQAEAQSALSLLQARIDNGSSAQGLLRASRHPQTPDEDLLIPARANTNAETRVLLRAEDQNCEF